MRLIYAYLRIALFLGFKSHAYNLSKRWGSNSLVMRRRYIAASEVQKDLLKRGYFECPSCEWATEIRDEHINSSEEYCLEVSEGRKMKYFILSKKYQKNGSPMFDQLGIIIADSIEEAAAKVGFPIVQGHPLPNQIASWVELKQNFHLDLMPEWDGTLPDDTSYDEPYRPSDHINVPIPTTQDLYDAGILE